MTGDHSVSSRVGRTSRPGCGSRTSPPTSCTRRCAASSTGSAARIAGSATDGGEPGPRGHRVPSTRRRITHRGHRRHPPARGGRIRGAGQRDRRARAGLRRHLQPRPDHDPRQRSAVARNRRGRVNWYPVIGQAPPSPRSSPASRCRPESRSRPGRDTTTSAGTSPERSDTSAPPSRPRGCSGCHRADARRARYRRHPGGGHEGGVRVDGQVATRRQGRDGRAAVRIPGPRRLHVQHRTRRGPSRISAPVLARPRAVRGPPRGSARRGTCRATGSSRTPAAR